MSLAPSALSRKPDLWRRAYQRKLPWRTTALLGMRHGRAARPDVVLPEFLPFLMMSDDS